MDYITLAPRSCVGRRAAVINPVADGKHSMTKNLGQANGQGETTLTSQVASDPLRFVPLPGYELHS
jgi:hypothetical protein